MGNNKSSHKGKCEQAREEKGVSTGLRCSTIVPEFIGMKSVSFIAFMFYNRALP